MKIVLWEQLRRQKRVILVQAGLGATCLLLAGLPWLPSAGKPKPTVAVSAQALCLGNWQGIQDHFITTPQGANLQIRHAPVRNSKLLLSQISLGIALCHQNYRVQSFCMGSFCPEAGATLVLAPRTQTAFR